MAMLSVDEALTSILQDIMPLGTEPVPLAAAAGRVLAQTVHSATPLPPFSNSAVDGYAVRTEDCEGASPGTPVMLRVQGVSAAGDEDRQSIQPGCAVRILTGAPMPDCSDAVLMQEDVACRYGGIEVTGPAAAGQHVRGAGEDMAAGEQALAPGCRITPARAGLLAACCCSEPMVYRKPTVALITTGDELRDIGTGALPYGCIRNSNRYLLEALVRESGAVLDSSRHVRDDLADTVAALRECSLPGGADVIVCAGGVSVGDRDFVKPAVEQLGTLILWKVAMKPGKPLAFGRIGCSAFFGLPGNPASALVTWELFVRPALRRLEGLPDQQRRAQAVLERDFIHATGREEYVRAVTVSGGGAHRTRPAGAQGSGILQSQADANSLFVAPAGVERLTAGSVVEIIWLTGCKS